MRMVVFTQNEGPFRMLWMDELAKYMEIQIYHINDYEADLNPKYTSSFHPKVAKSNDISRFFLGKKIFDRRKIDLKNDDLIFVDGYGTFAQVLIILKFIITKRAYGMSVDGAFIPSRENVLKKWLKTLILSKSAFVFSTSEETDKYLKRYGVTDAQIVRHYLSNSLSSEILEKPLTREEKITLRKKLTEKYNIEYKENFTIISVGRLIPRKGFDVLAKAIDIVNKGRKEENRIIIIIRSDAQSDYFDFSKYKDIHFLQYMDKEKLNLFYRAADLMVFPTRSDIWGLVIPEAMAQGLPVITTDKCLAGLAMIKDNKQGLIVHVDDVEQLAEAIRQMEKENLYEIGENCLNTVRQYAVDISAKRDADFLIKWYKNNINRHDNNKNSV